MTLSELEYVVAQANAISGARLQEVVTTESELGLGFWFDGARAWIWIDLDAIKPSLLPWATAPRRVKSVKSPLHLFLRAHFVDRTLHALSVDRAHGRVVRVTFGRGEAGDPELEVRVIPHLRNVIAVANGKRVAWQKPRELMAEPPEDSVRPTRDLDRLRADWEEFRSSPKGKKAVAADPVTRVRRELDKRNRALAKVDEELVRKREQPWAEVGAWLKAHQSLDVPAEWQPFVDARRKLAWNIETAFTRARELDEKTVGTERRRQILVDEIARLEAELAKPAGEISAPVERTKNPLGAAAGGAQGRTLRLSDEVTVVAGKSAADNLKLLRRARAWDLWIHLRDYPSSHAIVFRNKSTKVADEDLRRVAAWFVKLHLGAKVDSGARYEILIAECRHVRPIKGDSIGRVTYRDERTLIYRAP
jgi:macrodomain Ter protein organizer (MatP/YcbG family)